LSVDIVLPALADIERTIQIGEDPDIITANAYDAPPNSISGNLPCFVNLFGDATFDMNTGGEDSKGLDGISTRAYTATLYVAGAGTGVPGEMFDRITQWIDPAELVFLAHPSVGVLNGRIIIMKYLGHGKARGDLIYAGQQYYGVEFRLQVQTRLRVTYASNE
jgi:hypothetical protein